MTFNDKLVRRKLYYVATEHSQRSFEEFVLLLHWKIVPVERLICFYIVPTLACIVNFSI